MSQHTPSATRSYTNRSQLKRTATYASVGVALVLVLIKAYAWRVTHSVSLLSSLADSVLDFLASMINMVAVHHAMKPPDDEHRFGHGKIEALAALFQSIIIIISASFVLKEAVTRMFVPQPLQNISVGIIATVIAIILTLFLVAYQRHVISKTKSLAILADSMHYKGDILLNVGVLISIGLYTLFQWTFIDVIFGAGLALYIIFMTYKIIRSAFNVLLDSELPDQDREKILSIVTKNPEVKACHHLRTRTSGHEEFIQGHIVFDANLNIEDAQKIVNIIEKDLSNLYPKAEFLFKAETSKTLKDCRHAPHPS